MRLVVDHDHAPAGLEARQHPAQHFGGAFQRLHLSAVRADLAIHGAALVAADLARLEGMEVGDDQPGIQSCQQAGSRWWHQLALPVIVGGIDVPFGQRVDPQHRQTIADGDARRDDQEVIRITRVVAILGAIQVVVKQQARHHHGLAGAGGHLEADARQHAAGVAHRLICKPQLLQHVRAGVGLVRHLVQPDRRFHGFALGEEKLLVAGAVGVVEPVVKQLARHPAGDCLVARTPPSLDLLAYQVDQVTAELRGEVVDVEHAPLGGAAEGNLRGGWNEQAAAGKRLFVVEAAVFRRGVVVPRLLIRSVEDRGRLRLLVFLPCSHLA